MAPLSTYLFACAMFNLAVSKRVLYTAKAIRASSHNSDALDDLSQSVSFVHREPRFTISNNHVNALCSDEVVRIGCKTLTVSCVGEDPRALNAQLAKVLAASRRDVEALLDVLLKNRHSRNAFGVRSLCKQSLLHIPSILGVAVPKLPWQACLDDACEEETVDVSNEAIAKIGRDSHVENVTVDAISEDEVQVDDSIQPRPSSPEERARDLFRRALLVLFGIFPAVGELEDRSFNPHPESLLQEDSPDSVKIDVELGPRTLPSRHAKYRAYANKASAWIASALRKLDSQDHLVKKWFNTHGKHQTEEQKEVARKHFSKMLGLTGRLLIKKGLAPEEGGYCRICETDWFGRPLSGVKAYVMRARTTATVTDFQDVAEKEGERYVINVCEFLWNSGISESVRVRTIVHESSHHFGTVDKGYCDSIDCQALAPEEAQNNADSYAYLIKDINEAKNDFADIFGTYSNLVRDPKCNTRCDAFRLWIKLDEWQFDKARLPEGTCGRCREVGLFGGRCGILETEVSSGMLSSLCCEPFQCRSPDSKPSEAKDNPTSSGNSTAGNKESEPWIPTGWQTSLDAS